MVLCAFTACKLSGWDILELNIIVLTWGHDNDANS